MCSLYIFEFTFILLFFRKDLCSANPCDTSRNQDFSELFVCLVKRMTIMFIILDGIYITTNILWVEGENSRVKSFSSCLKHFLMLLDFLSNHSAKKSALSVFLFFISSVIGEVFQRLKSFSFFSRRQATDASAFFLSPLVTYYSWDFLLAGISDLQSSLRSLLMFLFEVFLKQVSFPLISVF